jgi:uncharacterized membrane protein YgcG
LVAEQEYLNSAHLCLCFGLLMILPSLNFGLLSLVSGCVLGLLRFFPSSRARRVQALAHFLQLHARLQGLGSISFFFLFSGPGRDVGLAQLRTQSQNLLPCLGLQFFARQHFGGRGGGGGGGAGGGSAGGGGAWCCRCC